MDIKINSEIRDYTESVFFGLSLRQFFFSVCAVLIAVGFYLLLKPYLGLETLSWVCILAASPFAALGFFKYNGLNAEKFLWVIIKFTLLTPKRLGFHAENICYELLKPYFKIKRKEALANNA